MNKLNILLHYDNNYSYPVIRQSYQYYYNQSYRFKIILKFKKIAEHFCKIKANTIMMLTFVSILILCAQVGVVPFTWVLEDSSWTCLMICHLLQPQVCASSLVYSTIKSNLYIYTVKEGGQSLFGNLPPAVGNGSVKEGTGTKRQTDSTSNEDNNQTKKPKKGTYLSYLLTHSIGTPSGYICFIPAPS